MTKTCDAAAVDIYSLDKAALAEMITAMGLPAYRARQLFMWLHQRGVYDFAAMNDLPLDLRRRLEEQQTLSPPQVVEQQVSAAGDTVKLLLRLADGEYVETVLMLYERDKARNRATCCVSSQTGCQMACAFCATGLFKSPRNLRPGEMAAQVELCANLACELGYDGISNVVFMGMGEPLLNLTNLHQAILLLNDEMGKNIGQRRITVSTCGLVPQIYQLADWRLQIGLAVSLHSADPLKRKRLMPVAAKYSLQELIAACRYFRHTTGRRLTMEYALFAGINDQPQDAKLLADLLTDDDILVNIIPANPVEEAGFLPSEREIIEDFLSILQERGCDAILREKRGADIDAACGQLRQRKQQGMG